MAKHPSYVLLKHVSEDCTAFLYAYYGYRHSHKALKNIPNN